MAPEHKGPLEERKSSNEELAPASHQPRPADEQPAASEENLRSLNEALQTVNAELAAKVDALGRTVSDLRDLFDTSQADRERARLHELQHRMKNVLATTGALAMRLLRDGPSLETFSEAFLGRLRAMAATHDLLSRGNWNGASLRELVEMTLCGHPPAAEGNIAIGGPDLVLAPDPATTLGTVLYELGTNAAKYGALSKAGGGINVSWWTSDDQSGGRIVLTWVEQGGPPVSTPMGEGFGTRFVKRCVEFELQGAATLDAMAAGVRWKLEFPMKGNIADA